MDNLLHKHSVPVSQCILNSQEECGVSGEFSLPDYCPDIAVMLKCMMTPCILNRQWSADRLLIDAMVNVRVLYLDEDRCAPHAVEFALPVSCAMQGSTRADMASVTYRLHTRYANCRALSPRKIEVRGAVAVAVCAETDADMELLSAYTGDGLQTRHCSVEMTHPIANAEKILTLNETLEFPEMLPPAEMLLGGECRPVVKECKLLSGKAIIKGQVYVHQLYAVDTRSGECGCLDFVLPYSQIVDVEGAEEGMVCCANVQLLSDTERCTVGPDGDNTMLDMTVKLLVQLQVFRCVQTEVLQDAYHTAFPISQQTEEICVTAHKGNRWEHTVLPMKMPLPAGQLTRILDVWVQTQDCDVCCQNGVASVKGRLCIGVLARDADNQVVYLEHPEDYCLEFASCGNKGTATVTVTELHYRVVEDSLELQIGVCVNLTETQEEALCVIRDLQLHTDQSYPSVRASALVYYAQAGESVWDIGARCHTSVECMCRENDLQDEVIHHASVLLVPMV